LCSGKKKFVTEPVYADGKWDSNDSAIFIESPGYYVIEINNNDIITNIGTICFWYRPDYSYTEINEDKYLLKCNNICQLFYASGTHTFTFGIYNGSNYTDISVSGTLHTFVSGTWLHIAASYDNTDGIYLYIDGLLENSLKTIWTQQSIVPNYISIGSISGSATNSCRGAIDDFRWFQQKINASYIKEIKKSNFSYD